MTAATPTPIAADENPAEKLVSKFASLLGTKALSPDRTTTMASTLTSMTDSSTVVGRELMKCVSKTVKHHEVICSLPSLDIQTPDEDGNSSMPVLPEVGEHFESDGALDSTTTSTTEKSPGGGTGSGSGGGKPHMEASVLDSAAEASTKAAHVEQKAAQSLGAVTSWTKSSVMYAPGAISNNVADSFSSLVDSRVRAWTLLLLRHSLSTGDSGSRSRLLSMLSSIIKVNSAKTTFRTLPLPESAANQPKEADVILPLLLEVDMQVSIQQQNDTVTLRAPGTVAGTYQHFRFFCYLFFLGGKLDFEPTAHGTAPPHHVSPGPT